jgi:two-component system NarL family response regulator
VLKILLVEDDELFRLGWRIRLQQELDIEIVAEAEDGEQAVEFAYCYSPDLVLLDIGIPGIGGIEACNKIKQQHPHLPVLVLTSRSEKPLIARLIQAGAQGYCLKAVPSESLILALRSVAAGASWWDQTATTEIKAAFEEEKQRFPSPVKTAPSQLESPLTKREQEILALVAAGKNNQEIASILYITPGTVRVHVHAILQKLEVRDRSQSSTSYSKRISCTRTAPGLTKSSKKYNLSSTGLQ